MEELIRHHRAKYGREPDVVASAPGRINLIGDHTDYNEGFVLPMAVDFRMEVAVSRRRDSALRFYSLDYDDMRRTNIQHNRYKKEDRWANYVKGVIYALLNEGYELSGLDVTARGNVPQGVGLSSSGALEIAAALAIQELFELDIPRIDLAFLAQKAETDFIGVDCGITDQFAPLFATSGNGVLVDTRTLEYRYVPIQLDGVKIVITNSNVPNDFAMAELRKRMEECSSCVSYLNRNKPGRSLRDYSLHDVAGLGRCSATGCPWEEGSSSLTRPATR